MVESFKLEVKNNLTPSPSVLSYFISHNEKPWASKFFQKKSKASFLSLELTYKVLKSNKLKVVAGNSSKGSLALGAGLSSTASSAGFSFFSALGLSAFFSALGLSAAYF